jgi:uncharacterized membrane protein YgaE (UPF0421/DUF939 family)
MENSSIYHRIHVFLHRTDTVWKTALAAAIAWKVAKLTGTTHPYLAPTAAILCVQVTINESIKRAYQRIIGVAVGVLLTFLIARHMGVNALSIGLLIFCGTAFGRWAKLGSSAVPQIGLSAFLALVFQHQSRSYPIDRVVETLVGALTAVVINMMVYPPNYTEEALCSLKRFSEQFTRCLDQIAAWVEGGCNKEKGDQIKEETHQLYEQLHTSIDTLEQAYVSLRYNPLAQKSRRTLKHYTDQLVHLRHGYTNIENMVHTLEEWAENGQMSEQNQQFWAEHLRAFTAYLDTWKETIGKQNIEPPVQDLSLPKPPFFNELPEDLEMYRYSFAVYNDMKQLNQEFEYLH